MATSSDRRLNAPLKTYSRRASSKEEPQQCNKRPLEEISGIELPSLLKKVKGSSIRNYFKPLPSPATSSTLSNSSDPLQLALTPPSSPPRSTSLINHLKHLQRPRRRLKSRPQLAPIAKMSDNGASGSFPLEIDEKIFCAGHTKYGSLSATPSSSYLHSVNPSPTRPRCATILGIPVSNTELAGTPTSMIESQDPAQTEVASGISVLAQLAERDDLLRREELLNGTAPLRVAFSDLSYADPEETNPDFHFHENSKFPCFAPLIPAAPTAPSSIVPTAPVNIPMKTEARKISATQALLDLGVEHFIECKDCGLYYNQTDKKDRAEHEKFHREFIEGKALRKTAPQINIFERIANEFQDESPASLPGPFKKQGEVHRVRAVDRSASNEVRSGFEEALERSYQDMDGLRVSDKELWSEIKNPQDPSDPNLVPRYKLYVYTIAMEPVGILLAERIFEASPFVDGSVVLDGNKQPALMSVDRIWVRKDCRHYGVATQLIDLARDTFIPGLVLSKRNIAFSFPTATGAKFARSYASGAIRNAWFLVHI